MEELLGEFSRIASQLIECAAVLVVLYGALEAFVKLLVLIPDRPTTRGHRKAIWQRFGMWLLLGLEFELAADIVRSVVSPTLADLAELGAIAVIRTFLNYFLERDLEAASRAQTLAPNTSGRS